MNKEHISVMKTESIDFLNIEEGGTYVDGTLGEAGHSLAILEQLNDTGKLYSFDLDQEAIKFVKGNYNPKDYKNWEIINDNFAKVDKHVNNIDGILLDLGVSSRQLNDETRGFSYRFEDASLDMRMDPKNLGVRATDLLNALSESELTTIFSKYGEERYSKRIAKFIKKNSPVKSVGELNSLINKAVPTYKYDKHPSTQVYQALRIVINDELGNLEGGLENGFKNLNPGGRFVVISFHSLEDRIVKHFFKDKVENDKATHIGEDNLIRPTEEEISENSRSHSAKMRVIEKI